MFLVLHTSRCCFVLDSGADVSVLFKAGVWLHSTSFITSPMRRHQADEVVQGFAVLPPLDIKVGASFLHQILFVTPVAAGKELPVKPDIDGLLPTSLFRSAFISYADHFAILEPR